MITLRRAADRGHASHGWLDSWHTFSFAEYHDPAQMGFGPLRVINEDRVEAGMGFDRHGHRDMEIVSYVLDGQLEHRDSMGTGAVIEPGDVQRMSAGRGVLHSEYNPSFTDPVHFLQIWIEPDRIGLAPSYEQKHFPEHDKRHRLRLIVSPDGADGSVTIHQDARVYAALLDGDDRVAHAMPPGRRAWVHVARGTVRLNGVALGAGDAAAVTGEAAVTLDGAAGAEVLVFDLP